MHAQTTKKRWIWLALGVIALLALMSLIGVLLALNTYPSYPMMPWMYGCGMGILMMLFMWFFWLLFWGAIVGGVVFLMRWLGTGRRIQLGGPEDEAMATLRQRYARGEISEEEYTRMRDVLMHER